VRRNHDSESKKRREQGQHDADAAGGELAAIALPDGDGSGCERNDLDHDDESKGIRVACDQSRNTDGDNRRNDRNFRFTRSAGRHLVSRARSCVALGLAQRE
jgi:hypothetical protein